MHRTEEHLRWVLEKLSKALEDVAREVKEFIEAPGAPDQPEDLNPTDKIGGKRP
jgi:hypothetical protein